MKSISFFFLVALIALSTACGATDDDVDYSDNNSSATDNNSGSDQGDDGAGDSDGDDDRSQAGTGGGDSDQGDNPPDVSVGVDHGDQDHGQNNDGPTPGPSCGPSGIGCDEGSTCVEEVNCPPCVEEDPPCNAACSVEYACIPDQDDAGGNNGARSFEVSVCEGNEESDSFDLEGMSLEGDTLTYHIAYGGGCEDHEFTLCWDGTFLESFPVQANLKLIHDANGDSCEAYISHSVEFSLEPLREAYQDGYGETSATIFVNTEGESFSYEF